MNDSNRIQCVRDDICWGSGTIYKWRLGLEVSEPLRKEPDASRGLPLFFSSRIFLDRKFPEGQDSSSRRWTEAPQQKHGRPWKWNGFEFLDFFASGLLSTCLESLVLAWISFASFFRADPWRRLLFQWSTFVVAREFRRASEEDLRQLPLSFWLYSRRMFTASSRLVWISSCFSKKNSAMFVDWN